MTSREVCDLGRIVQVTLQIKLGRVKKDEFAERLIGEGRMVLNKNYSGTRLLKIDKFYSVI